MTKKTFTVELVPPHLKTEEGAKRFDAAVEQRNQADFECFRALRDLVDDTTVYKGSLSAFLTAAFRSEPGVSLSEVRELVEHHAEQIEDALKLRRDADVAFSNALLGRS